MSQIIVAPSILASDFSHVGEEALRAEKAGADWIHLDVMDGHFVPNISFGPQFVAAVKRSTKLFVDVHLMIYNPMMYIERFVEAGADLITFHFEATEDIEDLIAYVRKCNVRVGLAFKPGTSASFILKYLDMVDLILIMTVEPGFGGQAFMPEMLDKVRFVRESVEKYSNRKIGKIQEHSKDFPLHIEVDGGINLETAKQCIEAGANTIVAGTSLYGSKDMTADIKALHQMAKL